MAEQSAISWTDATYNPWIGCTKVSPGCRSCYAEKLAARNPAVLGELGDKGKRAQSFRALCAVGRVRFPTFHPKWPAIKDHMLKFTGTGDDLEDDFADMCGLMGQGADKVLRAHVPKARSNVIEPRVGTLAWTRWASDTEKRMRNRPGRVVRAW